MGIVAHLKVCCGHTCPVCRMLGKSKAEAFWRHKEMNPSEGLPCDQKFRFKEQPCPEHCTDGNNGPKLLGPPPPEAA